MAVGVTSVTGSEIRLPSLSKYEVLEEIGHGGMATVYRARDPRLGREVAVKIIHPHLRDSTEVAARFVTEAQAVAKLRHPNIVEVFDVSGDDDRERYLVVELVRGRTIRAMVKELGPFPPEVAAAIGVELLGALAHAHKEGIVHRDVKPENVLVEIEADGAVKIKLTDFGIAKLLDEKGVTSTGQVLGSPAHMAPEQIEGGSIDARSDVFGIGVLLYECMVGHLPFEGNNPAQVLRRVLEGQYPPAENESPCVGKKFSVILDQALAHSPDDRFASAQAMKDALCTELKRLGFSDPKAEIAAFLDGPTDYAETHKKRLVDKLCALGAEARRAERAIDAAADYNRALAYAPDDPALLKIVSGMHRAEARTRLLKRALPLAGGTIAACILAFFVARWVRSHDTVDPSPTASVSGSAPVASASAPPVLSVATVAPEAGAPATSASVATTPTGVRTIVVPVGTGSTPAAITRNLLFKSVKPGNGVTVILDDDGIERPISTDSVLPIDGAAHNLHFQCVKNVCETSAQGIPAGKADQPVTVELKIKPATLLVQGTGTSYHVRELPNVVVKPGEIATIPVNGASGNWITVYDPEKPDAEQRVNLSAGQQANVRF